MQQQNIAVIGAGISGLSSAYLLAQKGHKITVFAKAFSPETTSNKAAAFWFPYHIRNDKRGIEWCQETYRQYLTLSAIPGTGISMQMLKKVLRKDVEEEEPAWVEFIPEGACKILSGEKAGAFAKLYEVLVPLIETQIFLPWLQQQLAQNGVLFIQKKIEKIDELAGTYDCVVNCSALGARELCNDKELIPVRGQVALLATGNFSQIYLDNERPLYVVPRKDAIIVGGTYEEHIETETTEPVAINRILKNAYEALPALRQNTVLGSWAGLRPYRPDVRVEKEKDKNIIHNYGHGGSGFTLAFGCAKSVCQLLEEFF
jgi:D-amino-acid oxidase